MDPIICKILNHFMLKLIMYKQIFLNFFYTLNMQIWDLLYVQHVKMILKKCEYDIVNKTWDVQC